VKPRIYTVAENLFHRAIRPLLSRRQQGRIMGALRDVAFDDPAKDPFYLQRQLKGEPDLKVVHFHPRPVKGSHSIARWEDGQGWLNLYENQSGNTHSGGVYRTPSDADWVAKPHRKCRVFIRWETDDAA
jgi:hypothetical protein